MPKATIKVNLSELIWVRLFWPILILTIFVVFLLGYAFLIKPMIGETKVGRSLDLKSREKTLLDQKNYLNGLKNLQQNYQKLDQNKLDKLNSLIADKVDLPIILSQLNYLAEENQSQIKEINIGSIEKGEIHLSLQLKAGDYLLFKKFLAALEKNARVFDVSSIRFSAKDDVYSLELKTYYLE